MVTKANLTMVENKGRMEKKQSSDRNGDMFIVREMGKIFDENLFKKIQSKEHQLKLKLRKETRKMTFKKLFLVVLL